MQQNLIFWPMILQGALTLAVYVIMSNRRIAAVKAGEARGGDFRIPNDPERSATAARNVSNQFELPVLFYVLCLALHAVGGVTWLALGLAWIFVLSRIAHAWVHLTTNDIKQRRSIFMVGWFLTVGMLLALAAKVALP